MSDQPRFELFAYWRTSAGYRVRVALRLKGIEVRERNVNLDAGEQLSPAFLAINPLGGVPALVEAGVEAGAEGKRAPITQSLAIMEFLDEIAPSPALLPGDAYGRARVRSIAAMLAADTHPLVVPRVRKYLTKTAGFDDAAWRAWQIQWFTAGLQAVEKRLSSESETGAYCHGNSITMADIVLASMPAVMQVFKVTVPDIPTVDRIVALCGTHKAFAESDPYRQAGAPAR